MIDAPPTGAERSLPALSDSVVLRFIAFTALYVAQGLPYGLLSVAVPAYMAEQDFSPTAIGSFIGITLLPWSLKLVNGPIMDRWGFLPMGRRRPWVLLAQAGMVVSSLAMGFLQNPLDHLAWLTALGFTINFFTAFQDVAVDGMAIEIIPINQQARANGFMWGGKTLGVAGATVGGAWMINGYGLGPALLGHAFLIGLVMLIPLLAREHPGERLLPWTAGRASEAARQLQLEGWSDIGRSLLRVFVLPVSLAGAIAIFAHNIVRGLLNAMLPVLAVQELGLKQAHLESLTSH
jgi:PAT family beta-lactamase induction signal transducer AmpG